MPSSGTLRTYNPPVTRWSLGYRNERSGFVAKIALPPFPTRGQQTGQFYELSRANLFTAPRQAHRADGAESHEIRWTFSTANFNCEPRAYNTFNTPRQKSNVLGPINLDREDADFLTEMLLLEAELDVYAYLGTAVTAGVTLTTTAQWDDSSGSAASDPQGVINAGIVAIRKKIGRTPNLCIMGGAIRDHFRAMGQTSGTASKILADATRYVAAAHSGSVTTELIRQFLGLERLVIADAVYNTTGLTRAGTVTNDYIWGDRILLAYVAPRPSLKTPTLGWTFQEQGLKGYSWTKAERRNAKFNEVEEVVDERVVAPICGYWIKDVLE